jgi:hypothetical protein
MTRYAGFSRSRLETELENRKLRKIGIKSELISRLEEDDKKMKNSTPHGLSEHAPGPPAGHIPHLLVETLIEEIPRDNYSRNDPKIQRMKVEAESFLKIVKLINDRDEVVEVVNSK